MSAASIHWGHRVGAAERQALNPVLDAIRGEHALQRAALVVGAPDVHVLRAVAGRRLVAFVGGGDPTGDPLLQAVVSSAILAVGWEDEPAVSGAPWLALPRPAPVGHPSPTIGVATCGDGDAPAAWAIDTWHGLTPGTSPAPTASCVRVVSARPRDAHARLLQALADGAAVVAVDDAANHLPDDCGPALRAHTLLEAAEAIELLAGATRLAQTLGRMGPRHLAALPSVDMLAERILHRITTDGAAG